MKKLDLEEKNKMFHHIEDIISNRWPDHGTGKQDLLDATTEIVMFFENWLATKDIEAEEAVEALSDIKTTPKFSPIFRRVK